MAVLPPRTLQSQLPGAQLAKGEYGKLVADGDFSHGDFVQKTGLLQGVIKGRGEAGEDSGRVGMERGTVLGNGLGNEHIEPV